MQSIRSSKLRWASTDHEQSTTADAKDGQGLLTDESVDHEEGKGIRMDERVQ
jgi:hypothetical protein